MFKKKKFLVLLSLIFIFSALSFSSAEELKCDDYKDKKLTQDELDKVIAICNSEI